MSTMPATQQAGRRVRVTLSHLQPQPAASVTLEDVYIVSAVRTPLGVFGGGLAPASATDLGDLPAAAVRVCV